MLFVQKLVIKWGSSIIRRFRWQYQFSRSNSEKSLLPARWPFDKALSNERRARSVCRSHFSIAWSMVSIWPRRILGWRLESLFITSKSVEHWASREANSTHRLKVKENLHLHVLAGSLIPETIISYLPTSCNQKRLWNLQRNINVKACWKDQESQNVFEYCNIIKGVLKRNYKIVTNSWYLQVFHERSRNHSSVCSTPDLTFLKLFPIWG